jgi:hypothetical protein
MGAGIVKRIDMTINIKEGHATFLGLNAFACTWWEVFNLGDGNEG